MGFDLQKHNLEDTQYLMELMNSKLSKKTKNNQYLNLDVIQCDHEPKEAKQIN